MSIQWYPGHMTAAKKKIEDALKINDLVIEILDARIPSASTNPMIKSIRQQRQRPSLKVLNKSDLADPIVTHKWIDFFNKLPNTHAIAISAKNKSDVKRILPAALMIAPHRGTLIKPLRMMIMGVPNVGKSTIINTLKNKKIAKVGNEPGVTKSVQRLILDDHTILTDTPGMMWPKIDNEVHGFLLAASHTIGINAYDEIETALVLYDLIRINYSNNIYDKYNIKMNELPEDEAFLELLAKKRGFIIKGGEYDYHKAATTFLHDYRNGMLGKITLEEPKI
jgi:ribosome biogenesis GTPase A